MKYHPNQTYHVPERILLLRPQAGWVHDNSWKCHLFVVCIGIYICSTYPNTYYIYSLQYFPVHDVAIHADQTIAYRAEGVVHSLFYAVYIRFYTFRFYNEHCAIL